MSERMTAGTAVIRACSCASPFQDARYGTGQRVHNVGKPDSNGRQAVECTLCKPSRRTERMREHARQHIKRMHG